MKVFWFIPLGLCVLAQPAAAMCGPPLGGTPAIVADPLFLCGERFSAVNTVAGQAVSLVASNVLIPEPAADLVPCPVQVSFFDADGGVVGVCKPSICSLEPRLG